MHEVYFKYTLYFIKSTLKVYFSGCPKVIYLKYTICKYTLSIL